MTEDECFRCKKHYTQSGRCTGSVRNCLMFDEEPRGKMVRTELNIRLSDNAETYIIKYNSKIVLDDGKNRTVEMTVIKINSLDLKKWICNITAEYHENEKPTFERKKQFKFVK